MGLERRLAYRAIEQNKDTNTSCHYYSLLIFDNSTKKHTLAKGRQMLAEFDVSVQKDEIKLIFVTLHRNQFQVDQKPLMKLERVRRKHRQYSNDPDSVGKNFLSKTPFTQYLRPTSDKWGLTKPKCLVQQRKQSVEQRGSPEWESLCQQHN